MDESRKQVNRPPGRRVLHSIVADPGVYQGDIAFVKYGDSPKLIKTNSGMRCMLIIIEVATRYAYVVPMADKSSPSVLVAFNEIYQEIIDGEFGKLPFLSLTTDAGKEFSNHQFQARLDELDINHYKAEVGDHFSLGIVDRFCRTLKKWLEDWMIEHDSLAWTTALPEVLDRYNTHTVRTIGATPWDARESEEILEEAHMREGARAYAHALERGAAAIPKYRALEVGDKVRIRLNPEDQPREKSTLSKASKQVAKGSQRWSNKVYMIVEIDKYSFSLVDMRGKPAPRTYRHHELLKVPFDSVDVTDPFQWIASDARKERRRKKE